MRILTLYALAGAVAGCGGGATDPTAAFVGRWNYDQPDRVSGRNIGTVSCPSPGPHLVIPQIGSISVQKTGDGTIAGTTDQGCTWSFAVRGDTATLAPAHQTCFNKIIGSSYTLDWSMSVHGAAEIEAISGVSHLPGGDCAFDMSVGSRTKVDPASAADPTPAFVGTWRYDAPDPMSGVNLEQQSCGAQPSYAPVIGSLSIAKGGDHQLVVTGEAGCALTFALQGNTAELDPPTQRCDATQTTYLHWAMTSDGARGDEFAGGVRQTANGDCPFLVAAGSLSKQ